MSLDTPETVTSNDDAQWMDVALGLARRGLGRTAPNPAVGAVLVSGGRVVGRGWTAPGGRPHAETVALAQAGEAARGATLYVTLEPCSHHGVTPPCADAAIASGVARVVVAMADPDPRVAGRGLSRLEAAGIAVTLGVREDEAARINAGHVARVTLGRPHVTLKLAVSRDGKVALAGGRPVAITGERSRDRVHMMRAEADAILVGVGTALADDPALTCRLPGMADRSPVRVILDSTLRTPSTSRLVLTARGTPVWLVCSHRADGARQDALQAAGCVVLCVESGTDGRVSLAAMLSELALRGVTRLMVEGGPTVAAALFAAGLVDAATIVMGPAALGPDAVDASPDRPLSGLIASSSLVQASQDAVGDDIWTEYERG